MTYAGIKSLIYCGVAKDDPRIKKAYGWIQKNYTVDLNPGMPEERAHWGLYYYYHTMAKCLDVLGVEEVVDAEGKKHDWRTDITIGPGQELQPRWQLEQRTGSLDGRRSERRDGLCADGLGVLQAVEIRLRVPLPSPPVLRTQRE